MRRIEDTLPPPSPRPPCQFVPQQMTFLIKDCDGGEPFFDQWVNTFVEQSARETGMTPILKPHSTGCVVIYWKRISAPQPATGPVEGATKKEWWPDRLRQGSPPIPERTTVVSVITQRLI